MRASVSGSTWRWVWHIPVTRSTQRRTQRCCLNRASCDTPSSRDRIRPRLRTSRSNASTGITAADPTTADSQILQFGPRRPSSSSAARRARASTCPADTFPAAKASCTCGQVGAHGGPPGRSLGVPGGAPPATAQQGRGRFTGRLDRRAGQRAGRRGRRRRRARTAAAATSATSSASPARSQAAGSASANSATNAMTPVSYIRSVYVHTFWKSSSTCKEMHDPIIDAPRRRRAP